MPATRDDRPLPNRAHMLDEARLRVRDLTRLLDESLAAQGDPALADDLDTAVATLRAAQRDR